MGAWSTLVRGGVERRLTLDPTLNIALGDEEAVLPINIAGNSQSSSILQMLDRHLLAAPHTKYRGKVDVRVARLGSLPELRTAVPDRRMLKIDAQGYAYKVLQGAA